MSTLEERLLADLKDAMRAGPAGEHRRETIRYVRAAIKNAEIDLHRPLTDAEIEDLLRKQIKQRRDSIEAFEQGGRPDLAARELEEIALIQPYLPQQMSADEVRAEAAAVIAATGAHGPGDLGKVMPVVMTRLKGRAEGRTINQVVRELLGS